MVGGGPFNLQPGQWTDDTSMALCLATSLIEQDGFDATDQMERYVRWWRDGYLSSEGHCFDIGGTAQGALSRFEREGDPYAGSTDPQTAGNGSLMRLAPVPMYYRADPAGAIGKETLLSPGYCPVEGLWEREPLAEAIARIAEGSFKDRNPPQIKGTGYLVDALEAALWAFSHSRDSREGALLAANLGHDADTTAAIYGQIAGAYYGIESIPGAWRERLTMAAEITALADSLHDHAREHVARPGST